MKMKRIISSLLAVLMLMSAFAMIVSADEGEERAYEYNTSSSKPTLAYLKGESIKEVKDEESKEVKYEPSGTKVIFNKEDKLESMDYRFTKDGYELYVDEYSGEVATRCIATGEILFTNPYNIADSKGTDSIKKQIMSQLKITFTDVTTGDATDYYSYEWASERNQIKVRNIKNGIRVEYTIGREEARMLVPCMIEKSSFQTQILNIMTEKVKGDREEEFKLNKLMAYYKLLDLSELSGSYKTEIEKQYPITKKMAVYVLDTSTSQPEKAKIEQYIKTYCPDYSYEDLDEDHMRTEYEAEDKNPPLFKMALEYSLDESGVTVRLPANGIRFNESLYRLENIEILPYMGAGAISADAASTFVNNEGYTFFPDGSGTLFDYRDILSTGTCIVNGQMYGDDFAYHEITGRHQEILRYPVFGIVRTEDQNLIKYKEDLYLKQKELDEMAGVGVEKAEDYITAPETTDLISSGFVAIVEEGDALMELSATSDIQKNDFHTVRMIVEPRPKDTYNLADAISVAENDEQTVVSPRKYTGSYKIRYIMLTDESVAEDKALEDYYETSYAGMAVAYREHLEATGVLTRLTEDDVKEDVPLYIETFGALQTTERFLSIPVDVMTPLTTFDDIQTMYDELAEDGIDNINFVLTGYAKGGMTERQVPYNLKWENAVSDEVEFEDLVEYAKEKDFGVYPDFDFAYAQSNKMFDGLTLKDHAIKTIDDRYTTRREYSATKHAYVSYFDIAISPAYFSHFYEKLTENYLEYSPIGISVSTLGTTLNSDFDEDEPFNREDSKGFTADAFAHFAEKYGKVLTQGGNSYTWKYVDYITDVALDSSRFSQSSASVPFLGMVLHGYVEIAGTPLNMEGNIDYALLKAIESGASLKFILSYRNTNNLKNYEDLSKYYSVRYDIWYDDVIETYNELNSVLADLQTSTIVKHEFVEGVRVPDDDELINDSKAAIEAAIAGEDKYKEDLEDYNIDKLRAARLELEEVLASWEEMFGTDGTDGTYAEMLKAYNDCNVKLDAQRAIIEAELAKITKPDNSDATVSGSAELVSAVLEYSSQLGKIDDAATSLLDTVVALFESVERAKADVELLSAVTDHGPLDAHVKALLQRAAAMDITKLAEIESKKLDEVVTEKVTSVNAQMAEANDVVLGVVDIDDGAAPLQIYITPNVIVYQYMLETEDGEEGAEDTEGTEGTEGTENEPIIEDDKPVKPVKGDAQADPYPSDENKIVYERYENGTAFLLNFNNYKVVVVYDGNTYTINAYGYVVLEQGK